jgi:hypothetical protein
MLRSSAPTPAPEPRRPSDERELIEAERVYRQGVVTVRDLIAPAAMKIDPGFLRLNGKYVQTLFVVTYPRYISVGWFAPIINYNNPLDIAMFFYPVPSDVILKQLKNKVGALEAQLITDSEKGAPRDPMRETALRDIEKLRDDLTQGTEKFFQFALYVTIYADTPEELKNLTGKIEGLFGSRLVFSKRAFFQGHRLRLENQTRPADIQPYINRRRVSSWPCGLSRAHAIKVVPSIFGWE